MNGRSSTGIGARDTYGRGSSRPGPRSEETTLPQPAKFVALLRGINVGRNNRIAMADLRAMLSDLGYTDVSTLLQSGNALFTAEGTDEDALAVAIEKAITARLGLTIRVLVRSRAELHRIVEANPLAAIATDHSKLLVTFLSHPPDATALNAIDEATYAPEVMAVGRREIYVWYPDGVRNARLSPSFFEKRLGKDSAGTARNWNTVTKLLELTG
jgi:uncharacterized protein (DUF1697 family)